MTTSVDISTAFTLKNSVMIKNRTFKSAMSEQLGNKQHNPTDGLTNLYKLWAEGGIGIMMSGNIMIDRTALGEPKNVVLDEASDLQAFKKWARAGSLHNTQFWAQLNHPGKQIPNFMTKEPVAPSAIQLENGLELGFNKPRALTESEIQGIIGKFATAARLAKEVGFTGVQIHGAHGYLVSQFLSSRHNQRSDQWGGSLENRMRFVKAVYEAMRAEVGADYPIGIKLNSADFMRGGFTEEESMTVVVELAKAGIDLIEVSGGTYESPAMVGHKRKQSTVQREAYFLDYAEKVRNLIDTPLVVTGGFRSTKGMNDALASGACDFVGLARPLAVVPDMPAKAMNNVAYKINLKPLTTGVKLVDKIATLDITWYEAQMARMAQRKAPKPNLSEWMTFAKTLGNAGLYAFRKRRA
ncbi:NADH oxidase [Oleiphilus messinensis]|uniref:NADH oxidase n=1 Tax=Oleiphilus messinensis TaxID=141451 RepID=A0A1Y0IA88_9GAMM|nr:NADH:flavin oxidoreductase/NADH oxidase family protein [Oleiphilus messinensis]ARU57437.1 NADH oxidase [Oleiphilus messinensis]